MKFTWNKKQKRLAIILVIIAGFIPYPGNAYHPFKLSVVDENGSAITNAECCLDFTLYPSLVTDSNTQNTNKNGTAFFKKHLVWKSWFQRRGYNFLTIFGRGGWSSSHSKLRINIPHITQSENQIRVAKLRGIAHNENDFSCDTDLKGCRVSYGNKNDSVPYLAITTHVNAENGLDLIVMDLLKSRNSEIENLEIELFVFQPQNMENRKPNKKINLTG